MPMRMIKKAGVLLAGFFLITAGASLVLVWWSDVVSLFRAGVGMTLALAGLLILYSQSK